VGKWSRYRLISRVAVDAKGQTFVVATSPSIRMIVLSAIEAKENLGIDTIMYLLTSINAWYGASSNRKSKKQAANINTVAQTRTSKKVNEIYNYQLFSSPV
jgi:hypothetical protein